MNKTVNKKILPQYSTMRLKVYVVDFHDAQFQNSGNFCVYDFIPKGEIWISDKLKDKERKIFVLRELYKVRKMCSGMGHDISNSSVNKVMKKVKKMDENQIDKLIKDEMYQNSTIIFERSHFNGHLNPHKKSHVHHKVNKYDEHVVSIKS